MVVNKVKIEITGFLIRNAVNEVRITGADPKEVTAAFQGIRLFWATEGIVLEFCETAMQDVDALWHTITVRTSFLSQARREHVMERIRQDFIRFFAD
jgi:hypothetical protein